MTIEIDPLETQHSDLDDAFRRHAFERLREGGVAVPIADVVAHSPSGTDTAQRTLEALVQRGMAELDGDGLIAIDGLSVRSTRHRMKLGTYDLFTWCAADAVGIPAALDEDAEVVTVCPHCSGEIPVCVRGGMPEANEGIVLWLPTSSCSHVVTQFCPDVNFFCSRRDLDQWASQEDRGEGLVLTVQEVAQLGRRWWAYLRPSDRGAEV